MKSDYNKYKDIMIKEFFQPFLERGFRPLSHRHLDETDNGKSIQNLDKIKKKYNNIIINRENEDFYIKNVFRFNDKNGNHLMRCKSAYSNKFGNLTKKEKIMLNYEKIIK